MSDDAHRVDDPPLDADTEKRDCPSCGGEGCDNCDGFGHVLVVLD